MGAKPTPRSQVKPQWPGAHKEDVDVPRDPLGLLPLAASESLFLINSKITKWMPITLGLPFPLVVSRSTSKGDNQVEEQEIEKLCWLILWVNFKSWVIKMQCKF